MYNNKKFFELIGLTTLVSFFLVGCSSSKISTEEVETKYTVDYIKENANISLNGKIVGVENNNGSTDGNGNPISFYMEAQKYDDDFSIAYDIGGYEIGLFYINGEYLAYSVIAEEETKYQITGNLSDSIMLSDYHLIENILDINYDAARVKVISLANNPSKEETVSENSVILNEDVVMLSDTDFAYVLYLDPETGECGRLQAFEYDEKGNIAEEFQIIIDNLDDKILYPENVDNIENVEEMSAEEFDTISFDFLFGAMANASWVGDDNSDE